MRYYIECKTNEEFKETYQLLKYYGFQVKLEGEFNKQSGNIFIADSDLNLAKFTHELKNKRARLRNLYSFEDEFLKDHRSMLE